MSYAWVLPHSGHPWWSENDDGGGQGLALFLAADFPLVILKPNLSDSTSRGRGGGRDKQVIKGSLHRVLTGERSGNHEKFNEVVLLFLVIKQR